MSPLQRYEAAGFAFRLEGDEIKCRPPQWVPDEIKARIKRDRDQILAELLLRRFTELVQHMGTDYGVVIDEHVIRAEMDDRDREYLSEAPREERAVWASLLAYRLARRALDHGG